MSDSPFVSINPAMRSGRPCLNHTRIPVEAVCEVAWMDGVDTAIGDWDLTRADVLVACWFAGAYGITDLGQRALHAPYTRSGGVWRRRWGNWAGEVHQALWEVTTVDYLRIPDPPKRDDDDA